MVLLNGPAGVGKTTVGRRLAATAANSVCIHGDDLKRFVVRRTEGSVPNGLTYVAGAALADMYLRAGYELVVFEFVFGGSAHVARFTDALGSETPVRLVTLWASLETVLERETSREGRESLGSRVSECWHELQVNLDQLGTIVKAEGCVEDILEAISLALE